jgi:type I restriction enzyme, S subunit
MEVREPNARYLVRPGFKQTEVGVIPEDWSVSSFQALAHIERGKFTARPRNDPRYFGGDIPFIQTGDVTNSNGLVTKYSQTLNEDGLLVSKLFPCGTLFFTIAANIGDVGFAAFDAACPDSLVAISPTKAINKYWLAHELRKRKSEFEKLASHNAQLNINLEKLRPYLLPVPPLAEQQAIAEALSDADALIESLEQLLAKKRQIKQGAMLELLTGQKRLPGFAGEWKVGRLGDVAQLRKERIDPRRSAAQEFCIELEHIDQGTGNLIGYTTTGDGSSLKSVFREDDVLFGKLRAYLRKYWLATRDGVCSTEIWVLVAKPSLLTPNFLFQLVKVDQFIEVASSAYGTHMPRSDWNVVKNYEVDLPSIEEQTAIATILSDMDAELVALETKLAKARQLKQGMMQELLTGRIRLA